jgi:hypothetical protein
VASTHFGEAMVLPAFYFKDAAEGVGFMAGSRVDLAQFPLDVYPMNRLIHGFGFFAIIAIAALVC